MSSSARMDCIITFKILFKILGTVTLQAFLNELKTYLRRRSSNVGHFRTSIACLLRTVLAARFWRANLQGHVCDLPHKPHTLKQYSKIGLIRLQYTTFALSLVRLLRSLPSHVFLRIFPPSILSTLFALSS